ncbi:MAG: hypothetical protein ABIZ49_09830 [Opitutaceae bacterium]
MVATAFFATGCGNIFMPKHRVLVDAISSPSAVKPMGQSYRLVAKRSVVSQASAQVPVVKACVDAALAGQGMFEPPPNVAPDLFIEISYGRNAPPMSDPASRETYLQLSARSNPLRALDRASGEEVWDVKVTILGLGGAVDQAMPLLSSVAVGYIASDTRVETKVEVPQKSPAVEAIRQNAMKALDAKSQGQAASAATPRSAAGAANGAPSPVAPAATANPPPPTATR